jgi:hypothetical protein
VSGTTPGPPEVENVMVRKLVNRSFARLRAASLAGTVRAAVQLRGAAPSPRWWAAGGVLAVVLLAGAAVVVVAWPDRSPPAAALPDGPVTFAVDRSLRPSVPAVEPVEGRDERRTVGVLAAPDGATAELVRDEVIVQVASDAELDAFLGRWNGLVLDSFPPDDDGRDHLVWVDVSLADPARLPDDLVAVEPEQSGGYRVSDDGVLRLLALAAAEWRAGNEVVLDWLVEPTGIADGEVYEASDITQNGVTKNVFDWSFMRVGGAVDTGVAAAWQLLAAEGGLQPSVRYMVVDRGFSSNFDFPDNSRLRKAEWGKPNTVECSGGTPCPYHGTDVVLAGMGRVGNGYGTAGPAGPVVSELVAVGMTGDYWTNMRRIEDLAEQHRPDVVNLSFSRDVYAGSAHTKKWTDRRMRNVQRTGALIVAAAGNAGRNIDVDRLFVPCESTYVMCVGGMGSGGARDPGSNYGTGDSSTSVEIYGPMCVRSINDPNRSALDYTTRQVCGTSVSSPFVGGVAALVMAADPALGPEDVRRILNDTANVGGLGAEVTGSQRKVNALRAVARALGIEVAAPAVTIQAPADGAEIGIEDWVDLRGTATDLAGRELPVRWESDVDGFLDEGASTTVLPLSPGTHVITASATDLAGQTGTAQVTVTVVDTPPDLTIISPPAGLELYEFSEVPLVATSVDPDTWGPVPDGDARWEVRRGGAVVYSDTGHHATLPAGAVLPGDYTVRFSAGGVTVQATFNAKAVPPGQTKPEATITSPVAGTVFNTQQAKSITFTGSGTDAEDGTVSGTRFRWVAYSGTTAKVLCQGSNVPGGGPPPGGPVIVLPKSCASFTTELALLGPPSTTWTVWLEVYDSTGLTGTDSVAVAVQHFEG